MKTLRLELRSRNNLLWHLVFDSHKSVREFSDTHGLSQSLVGELLNLKASPFNRDRTPRKIAMDLAKIARVTVDILFPEDLYCEAVAKLKVAEVDHIQFLALEAGRHRFLPSPEDRIVAEETEDFQREVFRRTLESLRPRERQIIEARFGMNGQIAKTQQEIAEGMGVSKERIRQIEAKAFNKLRHPARSRPLLKAFDGVLRHESYSPEPYARNTTARRTPEDPKQINTERESSK